MARLYHRAGQRLDIVRSCERVVTLSAHMRDEYLAHGLRDEQVVVVPYGPPAPTRHATHRPRAGGPYRLACMGRLEALKGIDLLIDALPAVRDALEGPVELLVIGDGAEASSLKSRADRVQRADPLLRVTFAGWQSPAGRDESLAAADLFVMPSVWPEPFGLAGLEAAHLGLPAVAFDVGGVADWLIDGETGRLATGAVPSSAALARAITDCLQSPNRHAMGLRASALAAERSPGRHAAALADVLTLAIDSRRLKARAH
jgi:glycosyltransferase involved in cell wall biosynthesis